MLESAACAEHKKSRPESDKSRNGFSKHNNLPDRVSSGHPSAV